MRSGDPAPDAAWRPRKSSGFTGRVQKYEITPRMVTSKEASTEWLTTGSRLDRRVNGDAGISSLLHRRVYVTELLIEKSRNQV